MDSTVLAALISGAIAVIGVFVSLITARWQIGLQKKELDLKARELDTATKQLYSELESLRQNQFTEVLKKRLSVYPSVWATVTKYTLQWKAENKQRNHEWAKDFLKELAFCNTEAGVFFSQAVYERFNELCNTLLKIETQLATEKRVDEQELYMPDRIWVGTNGEGGLATFLKDDLGSYRDAAIQARNYQPKRKKLDSVFDGWDNFKTAEFAPTQDLRLTTEEILRTTPVRRKFKK